VSKACNVLFSDHLATREAGKVLTAAVDPGPSITQIVRYELPQRAKQRQGMSAAQLERQAKTLGYRTPQQAAGQLSHLVRQLGEGPGEQVSGGLYLGIAATPGQPGPLITEAIPWRTPEQAVKVWEASVRLLRPFATDGVF